MELPQNLDSKFRFILVAARRARQLQAGAKPLMQTPTKKIDAGGAAGSGRGTGADRVRRAWQPRKGPEEEAGEVGESSD